MNNSSVTCHVRIQKITLLCVELSSLADSLKIYALMQVFGLRNVSSKEGQRPQTCKESRRENISLERPGKMGLNGPLYTKEAG